MDIYIEETEQEIGYDNITTINLATATTEQVYNVLLNDIDEKLSQTANSDEFKPYFERYTLLKSLYLDEKNLVIAEIEAIKEQELYKNAPLGEQALNIILYYAYKSNINEMLLADRATKVHN